MTPNRLPLALALCLGLALLPACKKKEADAAKAATPALTVSTQPVTEQQVARSVTVSGPIAAVEEMQLGVEVPGLRVVSLNAEVGQWVHRGQVLLTLDHRTLDAGLAQANANVKQAEAGAAVAHSNYTRSAGLLAGKYVSAQQVDQLRAAAQQADAQLATARAARDSAALQRSFAELRAPADGRVAKRLVQPGQIVAAGTPLLTVIRDGRLEWRADLPPEQLSKVKPGDRIALTTPDNKPVEGRVRAVSPGVDATTRTGVIYADLPHPEGLQPGTYLQGGIDTGTSNSPVVPAAAIVLRDGFPTVFVVDAQNHVHATRVETGLRTASGVEIRSGLKPGTQVVTEGAGFLAEGDLVRVVAPSAVGPTQKTAATP